MIRSLWKQLVQLLTNTQPNMKPHTAPNTLFRENTHNIRNFQTISNDSKNTVRYGLETVKYGTPLLWANLPEKYKTATSPNSFKTKIKTWKCKTCVCRLCQTYHF